MHAVGAHHLAVFLIVNDQMIANQVEAVAVETSRVGGRQALPHLKIEYVKAQATGRGAIVPVLPQANPVSPEGSEDVR